MAARQRLAAASLVCASLACSAVRAPAGGTATPAPAPTVTSSALPTVAPPTASATAPAGTVAAATEAPPSTPADGPLLADDFADNRNGWDVASDDTARREFRNGIYAIQVFNTVWFAWSTANTGPLSDIHLQVTVRNVGGHDPAFGVLCGYQNPDAFYFLGFGDDGYYGIARVENGNLTLLTDPGGNFTRSEAIALLQPAYTLEADCRVDGTLRLVVDGVTIAQVQDVNPYGPGRIGLFVQSFDNVPVEVAFDELVVSALP